MRSGKKKREWNSFTLLSGILFAISLLVLLFAEFSGISGLVTQDAKGVLGAPGSADIIDPVQQVSEDISEEVTSENVIGEEVVSPRFAVEILNVTKTLLGNPVPNQGDVIMFLINITNVHATMPFDIISSSQHRRKPDCRARPRSGQCRRGPSGQ